MEKKDNMAEDDNSFERMAEDDSSRDGSSSSISFDSCWVDNFEAFCSSDELSIEKLRRMTIGMPPNILENSSFLHRVCLNKNVT